MWGSERCSSFLLFMAEGGILPRFVTEDEAEKEENGKQNGWDFLFFTYGLFLPYILLHMDNYLFKKMQVNHYTLSFQVFFSLVHLVIFCLQREKNLRHDFSPPPLPPSSFTSSFSLLPSTWLFFSFPLFEDILPFNFFFWMTFMISPQNYLKKRTERIHLKVL